MSFFEDASLVLIPSGIKNQKVYSVKPTDGTGDLTFSRASSATRVQSDGLIEKVRTNIALQSQTFDDAGWSKVLASVTANATTAPDGTLTAEKLIEDASASAQHRLDQTTTSAVGTNTFSVFAKKSERTEIAIRIGFNGTIFNLDLGTIVSNLGTPPIATIQDAGNGWYRCSITSVSASANEAIRINLSSAGDITYTGDGTSGIFIWGAQMELSDFGATDYIATTTAAVSVGPVSGLPRLDYLNSSCPRLLLEPQAIALNHFSESFDNSYWQLKTDVTISANTTDTIDPSGYYGADKITETATTARHRVASGTATLAAVNNTASVFMKKGTARYGFVTFSASTIFTIVVDLEDGTITSTSTSGTIVAQKVENYGNGWYRISVTGLSATSGSVLYALQFGSAGSATPSYTGNIPSFAGSASNYLYAWGANLTAGAYATSYIPTLGAAVTRVADAASKTGISSLIGQTEGTLFVEVTINSTGLDQNIELGNGTNANRINLRLTGTNSFQLVIVQAASVVFNQTAVATFAQGQNLKIAAVYKSGAVTQMFVNGVSVLTGTAGTITGSLSGIFTYLAGSETAFLNSPVKQILVFPTALTDTQAIQLTA
jgi:hypothetical protein